MSTKQIFRLKNHIFQIYSQNPSLAVKLIYKSHEKDGAVEYFLAIFYRAISEIL